MRISHFGANPVRGGSPPRESRIRGAIATRAGAMVQEVARALRVVNLPVLSMRNAAEVITIYVNRARRVRGGLNWSTSSIQPRCAMDE